MTHRAAGRTTEKLGRRDLAQRGTQKQLASRVRCSHPGVVQTTTSGLGQGKFLDGRAGSEPRKPNPRCGCRSWQSVTRSPRWRSGTTAVAAPAIHLVRLPAHARRSQPLCWPAAPGTGKVHWLPSLHVFSVAPLRWAAWRMLEPGKGDRIL